MYTSGITPPKLGTLRDRVLRGFIVKESKKEIHFANLLALVASTNPEFDHEQMGKATEWLSKIKTVFTNYSSAELGLELTDRGNQELELIDAYNRFVKTLKPQLEMSKTGMVVKGLDKLFVAHGEEPPRPMNSEPIGPVDKITRTKLSPKFKPG